MTQASVDPAGKAPKPGKEDPAPDATEDDTLAPAPAPAGKAPKPGKEEPAPDADATDDTLAPAPAPTTVRLYVKTGGVQQRFRVYGPDGKYLDIKSTGTDVPAERVEEIKAAAKASGVKLKETTK